MNVTILVVFFVLVKNMLNQHESLAAAAGYKSYSVSVGYKYRVIEKDGRDLKPL